MNVAITYHEEVSRSQCLKKVCGIVGRVIAILASAIFVLNFAFSVSPSMQYIKQCMCEADEEQSEDKEEPSDLLCDVDDDVHGYPKRPDDSQLRCLSIYVEYTSWG